MGCYFFFLGCILGYVTGKIPTSFRLNRSSPGDGITWSIGVDRKHSKTIFESQLLEAAFCIADFMARPFD